MLRSALRKPHPVLRFAESLRELLAADSPESFEEIWAAARVSPLGWGALKRAWRRDDSFGEPALDEADKLLLLLLDRIPELAAPSSATGFRLRTFRQSELERLQHATAAALVAQRYGVAGLRTVIEDEDAPLARRYFSFFSLAERHPESEWPFFAQFLAPGVHHAFVGAAAETARFYPEEGAALRLIRLFDTVRSDLHLRTFLSPRILESLFVLDDALTLPFFRGLLVSGYTDPQPEYCEVTRALVMVRRLTGVVEPNVKFPDESPHLETTLHEAERRFEAQADLLHPVVVI